MGGLHVRGGTWVSYRFSSILTLSIVGRGQMWSFVVWPRPKIYWSAVGQSSNLGPFRRFWAHFLSLMFDKYAQYIQHFNKTIVRHGIHSDFIEPQRFSRKLVANLTQFRNICKSRCRFGPIFDQFWAFFAGTFSQHAPYQGWTFNELEE